MKKLPVTFDEIDTFLDRLMDEPAGPDYTQRLGRKWWHLEHRGSEIYGCGSCRPAAVMLARGKHDLVNIHLGKPVHDPENFLHFVAAVNEAAEKAAVLHINRHKFHTLHKQVRAGTRVKHE